MSLLLLMVLNQATPCPVPPVHPLESLQAAVERDRTLVAALEKSLTCRQGGGDCTADVTQCTTVLKGASESERAFDEAAYVQDLETPYQGEVFTKSRIWVSPTALDASRCPSSLLALRELLGQAGDRQSRRSALSREYVAYVAWAKDAGDRCSYGPVLPPDVLKARSASAALIAAEREKLLAAEARSLTAAAENARITAEAWAHEQKVAADAARARAQAARQEQLSAEETGRREKEAAEAAARAAEADRKSVV